MYLPTQKTQIMKLERIQFAAIRVALGLRMSTPTNILLGESKLVTIYCRAKILCINFLLKLYNNTNSIAYVTVKKYSKFIINDHRKKSNILYECVKSVKGIEHFIYTTELPGIYKRDYNIMKIPVNINNEVGKRLQSSQYANDLFLDIFDNDEAIKIFTDGSKVEGSVAVGCACVCPGLNLTKLVSINNKASIFTAECMALSDAMNVAIANKNRNIKIFTDSLSAVQSLGNPRNNASINPYILEVRQKNSMFHSDNYSTALNVYWIPSHRGIDGNERADTLAKTSTGNDATYQRIPFTDFKPFFKRIFTTDSHKFICKQGQNKGSTYFQTYSKKASQPWFNNKRLNREFIVTVCRCRSNHISLNESLAKIKVVPSADCDCGPIAQNLNHILWQCPLYDNQRALLLSKLATKQCYPPHDIKSYLAEPNIVIMKIVIDFLNNCNI